MTTHWESREDAAIAVGEQRRHQVPVRCIGQDKMEKDDHWAGPDVVFVVITANIFVVTATVKRHMGHRHTKEEILAAALEAALEDGLSQLTFGRLAKRMAMNDRTIVYYFPSKDDLLSEVIVSMGSQLQSTLAGAFVDPAADHLELLRAAWPVLSTSKVDPIFALFFEANGLAASGRVPYQTLIPALVDSWIEWTSSFLTGTAKQRRVEAETAIAVLDGLLLLRQLAGPEAAQRAARRLGISGPHPRSAG